MKTNFQVLLVAFLVAVSVSVSSHAITVAQGDFISPQAQIKANELVEVPVVLPELADIQMKGGEFRSGRIVAIDTKKRILSLQRSGLTAAILLKQVEKVVFRNSALAYRSTGVPIIRGERDRPRGKQVTWSSISLSTFNLKNPTQGQAVVRLGPPAVSVERLRGIQAVAKDRQYVVDEMQLNLQQGTMNILATPY